MSSRYKDVVLPVYCLTVVQFLEWESYIYEKAVFI